MGEYSPVEQPALTLIESSSVELVIYLRQSRADRPRLLRTVEDGYLPRRLRQGLKECLGIERSIEPNFDQSQLLPLPRQPRHGFFGSLRARTHHHHHTLGVFRARTLVTA